MSPYSVPVIYPCVVASAASADAAAAAADVGVVCVGAASAVFAVAAVAASADAAAAAAAASTAFAAASAAAAAAAAAVFVLFRSCLRGISFCGMIQMLEIIPQALKVQVSHFLEIVVLRFRRLLKSKPSEDIFHLHADSFEVCLRACVCVSLFQPVLLVLALLISSPVFSCFLQ